MISGLSRMVGGSSVASLSPRNDIFSVFGDGGNTHQYLRSTPWLSADPAGTDWSMAGQIALQALSAWLSASGTLNEAKQGLVLSLQMNDFFHDLADNQSDDIDWATDWSRRDDDYSTSAKTDIVTPQIDSSSENAPAIAGVWGLGSARSTGARALTMGERNAMRAEARAAYKLSGKWVKGRDVHHRVPLDYSHLMPGHANRPSNLVIVPRGVHHEINEAWRVFKVNLRGRSPSATEVQRMVQKIDDDFGSMMRPLR